MHRFSSRIDRLGRKILESRMDGLLIGPGPNLRYLTGIHALLTERPLVLFVTPDETYILAPKLEEGLFEELGVVVLAYGDEEGVQSALPRLREAIGSRKRWGVDGGIPFRFIHPLQNQLSVQLELADRLLLSLREVKDQEEIRDLRRAAEILRGPVVAAAENVRAGVTERKLESEIKMRLESEGAHSVRDALIQFGANSANPHSLPAEREAKDGDVALIDVVCTFNGYHADITRTVCVGDNPKFRAMYQEVLAAELAAITRVASGVKTGDVDHAARSTLAGSDLDQYFVHRTGHGLGLDVHEAPFIVPNGRDVLAPGMVHTVEPGVYLPGEFGVRIEDDVLVTSDRGEVLTRVPTEFGWWLE